MNLVLDQSIILQNHFSATFSIKSNNFPLIVSRHYDQLDSVQFILNMLVGITLVLFVVGSWTHKMIGIETMTAFLSIFFTLGIDGMGNDQIFSPLAQLRYLINYGDLLKGS